MAKLTENEIAEIAHVFEVHDRRVAAVGEQLSGRDLDEFDRQCRLVRAYHDQIVAKLREA